MPRTFLRTVPSNILSVKRTETCAVHEAWGGVPFKERGNTGRSLILSARKRHGRIIRRKRALIPPGRCKPRLPAQMINKGQSEGRGATSNAILLADGMGFQARDGVSGKKKLEG